MVSCLCVCWPYPCPKVGHIYISMVTLLAHINYHHFALHNWSYYPQMLDLIDMLPHPMFVSICIHRLLVRVPVRSLTKFVSSDKLQAYCQTVYFLLKWDLLNCKLLSILCVASGSQTAALLSATASDWQTGERFKL
jgi:hypothetical protein